MLKWLDGTPTQIGFYWWQPTYSKPRIVYVYQFGEVWFYGNDGGQYQQLLPNIGRWAGPIPEPAE